MSLTMTLSMIIIVFLVLADGYCRSEGVVVLLLGKSKMAMKSYLTVVDAMDGSDGYKQQGKKLIMEQSTYFMTKLITEPHSSKDRTLNMKGSDNLIYMYLYHS